MDCALRTVLDAVHAKVTFGNPKGSVRVASAMTVAETFFAIGAKFDVAPYLKKRPEGKKSEKSTQGADSAAPEFRHISVRKNHRKEDKAQQGSAIKKGLLQIEPTPVVINCREH